MDYKNNFIAFMARSGALTFGDFTTKSGRKTPYFVNTGMYSKGTQIAQLGNFYADCMAANLDLSAGSIVLFGPAYKGIPLAVATAISLAGRGIEVNYCFNRKEVKGHGEGGTVIGHKMTAGDRVFIIEDVITAGTAVREVLPIIRETGAKAEGLIISVDRMERGAGNATAIQEVKRDFGIDAYPIVTVKDIIRCLHNRPVDGNVFISDEMKARMENYMSQYCVWDG
jgi:orotate phosphoribosyltransferase